MDRSARYFVSMVQSMRRLSPSGVRLFYRSATNGCCIDGMLKNILFREGNIMMSLLFSRLKLSNILTTIIVYKHGNILLLAS